MHFNCIAAAPQRFRVAVVGGGPSGACAAEALARNPNIDCTLFERKMDNAKPCGGISRLNSTFFSCDCKFKILLDTPVLSKRGLTR